MGPRAAMAGVALLAGGQASAQEKLCAGSYNDREWLGAMDAADGYMANFKLKEARVTLYAARELVPCLDAIVKPSQLGRFSRQLALLEFLSQDEDTALRWARLSVAVAAALPWPADVPEEHPFRELVTTAEPAPLVGPTDRGFALEPNSAPFLNGRFILYPQAYGEVSNLFQLTDKAGKITSAYWIDGAAFSDELLGEPGKTPKPPKWWTPEPSSAVTSMALPLVFGVPVADTDPVAAAPVAVTAPAPTAAPKAVGWSEARAELPAAPKPSPAGSPAPAPAPSAAPATPPAPVVATEPVPAAAEPPSPSAEAIAPPEPVQRRSGGGSGPSVGLLGAGGASAAVAGVLFAVAAVSHGSLDDATSEDDLVAVRSRTNGLALGATVASAAAIGLTATALVADEGWFVGFSRPF